MRGPKLLHGSINSKVNIYDGKMHSIADEVRCSEEDEVQVCYDFFSQVLVCIHVDLVVINVPLAK